jgi:CheY-like chemotaxis protein
MDRKFKILVIDDEEDICHFSKSILEKTGKFEVLTSMNPLQGINLAKMHQPDLVLLDVFMPEMDGSKVAEQLLKEEATRNIPIVFLTALVKENEVGAGKIGGRRFIPKPVAPQELVNQVKSILNIKD